MSIGIETRNLGSPRSSDRGATRGVPPAARRAPPRGRTPVADVDLAEDPFDSALAYPHWNDLAPTETGRHGPAELLFALIERMGGTATSGWKGMYVNLVV
jgi:hypothetical protein